MKKYGQKELFLLWIDSFEGIAYNHKKEIYEMLAESERIKGALVDNKDRIVHLVGEDNFGLLVNSANEVYLKYVLGELDKRGITAITFVSDGYPTLLLETDAYPLVLYAKGNLSLLNERLFAIVGSRKTPPIAIAVAEKYATTLADAGLVLVTGIAEGVDSAVLNAALKGGRGVISVTAGGFDNIYPQANAQLFEEVAEKGLVLTEYPPSVQPKPYYFPIRNRIIAGLSIGTLIISGGLKSGTMHTAYYAIDYNRDLFAVPYGVGNVHGAGCNELIKKGAMLTDTPQDITGYYNIKVERDKPDLTDEECQIITLLSGGGMHVEKICESTGKQIFEISPVLSVLEIKGLIVKTGTNIYGLTENPAYLEE